MGGCYSYADWARADKDSAALGSEADLPCVYVCVDVDVPAV